jgi:hypothetical protein
MNVEPNRPDPAISQTSPAISTGGAPAVSGEQKLCLSCANKHRETIKKARGLAPGAKCDQCDGHAVMAIEFRVI